MTARRGRTTVRHAIRAAVETHSRAGHPDLSIRERSELADSAYAEHVKRSNVTVEP